MSGVSPSQRRRVSMPQRLGLVDERGTRGTGRARLVAACHQQQYIAATVGRQPLERDFRAAAVLEVARVDPDFGGFGYPVFLSKLAAVRRAWLGQRRQRRRDEPKGCVGHARSSEPIVGETGQHHRDVREHELVERCPFFREAAHRVNRGHASNRSREPGRPGALAVGREEEMPNVRLGVPQQMAQYARVFSETGRERGGGHLPPLDQNRPVPPEVSDDVADEVLAAVVPWRRHWFGHEENVSHRESSYAPAVWRARA